MIASCILISVSVVLLIISAAILFKTIKDCEKIGG